MFEVGVGEAGQNHFPTNLADRRLQLQRYRSRWDNFNQPSWEAIAIPPFEVRICEKGYLAYAFRNASDIMHHVRVIRLPSTCNGVTRGEWVIDTAMSSPDAIIIGMTLQPELDILVVIESSGQQRCALMFVFVVVSLTTLGTSVLYTRTIRLSDGQPHLTFPMEMFQADLTLGFYDMQPFITRSRLALFMTCLHPEGYIFRTLRVYDLWTRQVILVRFIRSPPTFMLYSNCYIRINLGISIESILLTNSGCWS